MAWLHTWVGLIVGWMLFCIFIAGAATYYRYPITDWMQPERLLARAGGSGATPTDATTPQVTPVQHAIAMLAREAPHAARWIVDFPMNGNVQAAWQDRQSGAFHSLPLPVADRAGNAGAAPAIIPRDTQGGDFFYTFHFQLHYLPWWLGRWIVSGCAMFMLVALVSGIITHRRLFVDFFTFRPGKGIRSWLDGHVASGVLALPFHLMITYTGLVTLMGMLLPWGLTARYPAPAGAATFLSDVYDYRPPAPPAGRPATFAPIAPLLQRAVAQFGGQRAARVSIDNPGDAAATVKVMQGNDDRLSNAPRSVTFDGVTGRLLATRLRNGGGVETAGVMIGIHEAGFATPVMRALFFVCALLGAAMIASGLVMWPAKQRQKHAKHTAAVARAAMLPASPASSIGIGVRVVEHLNLATICGMPIAIACYFWANRLLPAAFFARGDWEIRLFFVAWGVAALHPLLRHGRRAWIEQLGAAAGLFLTLPILDAVAIGTWVMPAFDIVALCLGGSLAATAIQIHRHQRMPTRGAKVLAA